MDQEPRTVQRIIKPQTVLEGAGVRLKRSIATRTLDYLDPFLLFDHFGSDDPSDYIAGFPMHPHRGIETVTYMLAGTVNHKDSLGNSGTIGPGDVQWMTAGRGILHEEMPRGDQGRMEGFQLWVNLPARLKMTQPRYQEIVCSQIPVMERDDGVQIRVIAGQAGSVQGAVTGIAADPVYLDVTIPQGKVLRQPIKPGHSAFAYVFAGEGVFQGTGGDGAQTVSHPRLVILSDGDHVEVGARDQSVRILLVSGKPLYEPIARHGPFVMNTRQEIEQALRDLRSGTFVQVDRRPSRPT